MKFMMIAHLPKTNLNIVLTREVDIERKEGETLLNVIKRELGEEFQQTGTYYFDEIISVRNEGIFMNKDGSKTKSDSAILNRIYKYVAKGWKLATA